MKRTNACLIFVLVCLFVFLAVIILLPMLPRFPSATEREVAANIEKCGGDALFYFGRLKSVRFRGGKVPDSVIVSLSTLPYLNEIELVDTDINDRGLMYLSAVTTLRYLYLDQTNISDVGLEYLGKMDGLEMLTLNETLITDAGLKHLKRLKNLRSLNIKETRISREGMQQLKRDLPNTSIYWKGDSQ